MKKHLEALLILIGVLVTFAAIWGIYYLLFSVGVYFAIGTSIAVVLYIAIYSIISDYEDGDDFNRWNE